MTISGSTILLMILEVLAVGEGRRTKAFLRLSFDRINMEKC